MAIADIVSSLQLHNLSKPELVDQVKPVVDKLIACTFGFTSRFKNAEVAIVLNLADYKICSLASSEAAKKIMEHLGLEEVLTSPLLARINAVSHTILQTVSLHELQWIEKDAVITDSPLWYALTPDEEFLERSVLDLKDIVSNTNVVTIRLNELARDNPDVVAVYRDKPYTLPSLFRVMKINIAQFTRLTGSEINACKRLPEQAFGLLSDEQIQKIDWSKLTAEHFVRAMKGDGQMETIKRRLAMVSAENIAPFIEGLPSEILDNLPAAFFKSLQLSKLTERDMVFLFPTERHAFIPFISPAEMAKGIHLLLPSQLDHVSDAQFVALDFASMDEDLLRSLLIKKERIPLIPTEQLSKCIHHLYDSQLDYITDEQFAALNFATLSQDTLNSLLNKTERISLIPVAHLGRCIPHMYSSKLDYITDVQFAALNLSAVPASLLSTLLQKTSRIPQIPPASVRSCVAKVPGILTHLTSLQCQMLDLGVLQKNQLEMLFPSFAQETYLPDYTHTFDGKLHRYVITTSTGRTGSEIHTEESLQKHLNARKQTCITNLRKFNQLQIEVILSKLSPDVKHLFLSMSA